MEDKLEPNMYVRLNCNYALGIGKTIGEIDEDNFIKTKFKDGFECSLPTYMIKKASHNIIDLIEVGDYVNGLKVSSVGGTYYGRKDKAIYCDYCENKETGKWTMIYDDEIKSIVTKEQFESMKYEVK